MNALQWLVPWEFSPTLIVVVAISAVLYVRGARRRPPGPWRQVWFWTGLAVIYIGLHTRLDYYAEREFFVHRLQHLGLHHLGPFLIALSLPGSTLRAGMPLRMRLRIWRPLLRSLPMRIALGVLLNPWVASILFFGIIGFWLIPSIHFIAMLDWRLYRVMNWSVTVDGLLFWWLVLDSRSSPPARLAAGARVLVPLLVAVPQILIGAFVTLSHSDLYPIYDLCGRAFADISSMRSQTIGGLILWIPSAMMSALAALIALGHWMSLSARHRLPQRRRPALPGSQPG